MADEQKATPAWVDFTAGTVAGVASLFCGHPFDTVKVNLQCSSGSRQTSLQAVRSIIHSNGIAGLYRGITSPLIGVAAVNSMVFGSYGMAMRWQLASPNDAPTLSQIALAGSTSGVITALITTPIERLKVIQQCTSRDGKQPSVLRLLRTMNLQQLYRGFSATILRDLAYGPYFLTYEAICRGWPGPIKREVKADLLDEIDAETASLPWTRLLIAGGAAGIVGWTVTFPFDVVKSRMQATNRFDQNGRPDQNATIWKTIKSAYAQGGPRIFFAGIGPTILRAVPVNIVTFLAFEATVAGLS